MNVAIILAGGIGSRVGADVPKQFIEVGGKPILAYTVARFEQHPRVDAIEIVCVKPYIEALRGLVADCGFEKVRWVTPGGATFQESVMCGLRGLRGELGAEDIVLIHYGASPYTPAEVISDAIEVCEEKGNASPASPLIYLASKRASGDSSAEWLDRDEVICLNSPQALTFGYACRLYERAERLGLLDKVDPHTTSLMQAMGDAVFFSKDVSTNIKITTAEDVELFRYYVAAGGPGGRSAG